MKRILQALFLLASALALTVSIYFLVQSRTGAAAAAKPVATRQISPESPASSEPDAGAAQSAVPVNHVSALPDEVILSVMDFNTGEDNGAEQILTVRKAGAEGGRLTIVVADYLDLKNEWQRSWEGEILCSKLTTLSIQAKDLLGDHGYEIVCTGMDDSGEQTITVFRKEGASSYAQILALTADSVAIGETDRGEAYQQGQAQGDTWPVLAFNADKESSNLLDQVKDKYVWDSRKGLYEKTGSERIPGATVQREIVEKVLTGAQGDFESFLQGAWYEAGKGPFDPTTRIIVFDKADQRIVFYKPGAEEIYRWTESQPTRYGIYARCQNELVDNLVRFMDVELTGADIVSVRVFQDLQMKGDPLDDWNSSFQKMPPGSREAQAGSGLSKPGFKLEGPYRSSAGTEINFAQPLYSLKSPSSAGETGGFELYGLGPDTVLELVSVRPDGPPPERKTYKAVYSEIQSGKDLVRRLVLSPGKIEIDGLKLLQEDDLVLEQRVKGS
jgi:hypothetical protein